MKRFLFTVVMLGLLVASWGLVPSVQAQSQISHVPGSIDYPSDVDTITLHGSFGQWLLIGTTHPASSNLDPQLTLYGPDGSYILMDDDGGDNGNALILWPILQNGTYTVEVSSWGGTTGSYSVFYGIYDPVNESITYPGDTDTYTFYGQAGQLAIIGTTHPASSNLDPQLTLYGPDGSYILTDDDSGGNRDALIFWPILQNGTYTVEVSSWGDTTGSYSLLWINL